MNTTTSTPSLRRLNVDAPLDTAADAVCPHCGGRIDTTTTAAEPAVAVVVEPGPRTVGEARAVRVVLAGILRVVFEVIAGRRPVAHLDAVVSASVGRYEPPRARGRACHRRIGRHGGSVEPAASAPCGSNPQ